MKVSKLKNSVVIRKQSKTFEINTYAFYPVRLSIKAPSKKKAMEMLDNMDAWHSVKQDHNISEWNLSTFYLEDLKEVPKKTSRKRNELTKEEMNKQFPQPTGFIKSL